MAALPQKIALAAQIGHTLLITGYQSVFMKVTVCLIYFFIVMLYAQPAFTKENGLRYQINGNILNLKGKLYLIRYDGKKIDSCNVTAGRFYMAGSIAEPYLFELIARNGQLIASFVLKNCTINIQGDFKKPNDLRISGDSERNLYLLWQKSIAGFDSLRALIAKKPAETAQKSVSNGRPSNFVPTEGSIDYQETQSTFNLISNNRAKFFSLFLLKLYYSKFTIIQKESLYNLLDRDLKENSLGKTIFTKITNDKSHFEIKPGVLLPDISMNNAHDQKVSLSSFRGKYVLLIFWASWCQPCRQENKELAMRFKLIPNKRIKIVTISIDKEKNQWLNAIKTDNMPWINLCDFKGKDADQIIKYNINEIPYCMLIAPSGRLIAVADNANTLISKFDQIVNPNIVHPVR